MSALLAKYVVATSAALPATTVVVRLAFLADHALHQGLFAVVEILRSLWATPLLGKALCKARRLGLLVRPGLYALYS
jgi:hypothetical protein